MHILAIQTTQYWSSYIKLLSRQNNLFELSNNIE